jgi:hypothetical protein
MYSVIATKNKLIYQAMRKKEDSSRTGDRVLTYKS